MFRTLFTSAVIIAAMSTQASAINIQDDAAVAAASNEILQGAIEKVEAGQERDFTVEDRVRTMDADIRSKTHELDNKKSYKDSRK